MACNAGIQIYITEDKRPIWPYEMWSFEECSEKQKEREDMQVLTELQPFEQETKESVEPEDENEIDKDVIIEADHWSDEMESDIPESCPINTLIKATASPVVSETEEGKQMKDIVMPMLESTLDKLVDQYKLFQGSFLLPVGSMAEDTKVGKADEFDFAVLLPVLAQKEYIGLLNKGDEVITDPNILTLLGDIWDGNLELAAGSIQTLLRELWSIRMMDHIPEGWTVLNPTGHSNSHSVAATFHLFRESDKNMVDLDVCFWVPLDKACLSELQSSKFPQALYLSKHCLDDKGLVYVVLPHDTNVSLAINCVRFAMSVIERAALQKYGTNNGRLQCYRTCKCLASALLPKTKKKEECDYCFDGILSSYCLKNVVLYMAANHTSDEYWTVEKLPNRVVEVFDILTFCMKVNALQVSAYFTPYQLSIDPTLKYDPGMKCVTDSEANWSDTRDIPCTLPDLRKIKEKFADDETSLQALSNYEEFLSTTEWRYPEVICRLDELLNNLMQEKEEDRREMVDNQGWNLFGLSLPDCESYIVSVDTKL